MKKIISLIMVLVILLSGFSVFAVNEKMDSTNNISIEKIKEVYNSNGEEYFEKIPSDLLQKYSALTKEIDKKLFNGYGKKAPTSSIDSLNDYVKYIRLSIMVDSNDNEFKKKVKEFLDEAENMIITKSRVEPKATIESSNSEKEKIEISINGNNYSTSGAVDYAYLWTEEGQELRNPDYDYYDGMNDCTNFVSQVLYEGGGLSMIRIDHLGFDYNDPDNWYYEDGEKPSYTWGGAQNLYDHLDDYSSNVRRTYSTSDLEVGDIIQWDLYDDGNFHIGHSTVVTKINGTSWSDIKLTYHTTDRVDKPASDLVNAGYKAYAWAIDH